MFSIMPEKRFHQHDGKDPMLHIYFYLLPFACWFVFVQRKKEGYFFMLLFLLPFILFESYQHIQKVQRYLLMIMVPVVLLISSSLFSFYIQFIEGKEMRKIAFKFFLCVLFFSFVQISFLQLGSLNLLTFSEYQGKIETDVQEYITDFINVLSPKDVYVTSYILSPAYSFYLNYAVNSSLPFGYHGPADYSMYDLRLVGNLTTIHNAYVIIDSRYQYLPEEDPWGYYYEKNATSFKEEKIIIPKTWTLISSLTVVNQGVIIIFNVP